MEKIILFLLLYLFTIQNSEAQWYTQQSGTTNALYDIEFINKNTGWSCGDGIILKTTNGGINWANNLNDAPFKPYSAIFPVDSNVIYAVGFFRTFIKSTNGGENWSIIENGNPSEGDYYSLYFINQNTGWAGVNLGSGIVGIKKTTDGGNNFIFGQTTGIPQDLYFKDSLNGLGVGGLSYIYRTTDGGLNWSSYSIVQNGDFYRVSFINGNTGFTSSTRAFYKTTNFGVSWDSIGRVSPLNIDVTSIEFCNENTGWAGTQSPVYKTTNGGRNWVQQFLTGVVYSIYSFNDSLVWTCGNAGRIWHTSNGGISNLHNISNSVPSIFKLYQNYPNPFNGQTKIKIDISKNGIYEMDIFNTAGKKIETIFNGELNTGQYELKFDGKELSSGIYFYRLSGNYISETKKLILIK
ncbi:MAG TPA: YCF48-related protein [Ignavibacteria bacterium]|nr:hypothetical protein [Bacteroidota bacterium]HRI86149.1 YCF48-related protein [Ignavibacteria bacterium]HRJ98395.1 YCF48-related protein [Ignavibacteria bacterium]